MQTSHHRPSTCSETDCNVECRYGATSVTTEAFGRASQRCRWRVDDGVGVGGVWMVHGVSSTVSTKTSSAAVSATTIISALITVNNNNNKQQ